MRDNRISEAVISRLPKYYRYLSELEAKGTQRVSSSKMSADMGLNASQIRRDLNCFGGFGQQGYGYQVNNLKNEIKKILGIGKKYTAVVVGAGNIGQALYKYTNFAEEGYNLAAIFDADQSVVDKEIDGITVRPIEELADFVINNEVNLGVITAPKRHAQRIADELVLLGVKGIWNFAPVDVVARKGVCVENVHLSDSLFVLSYRMRTNGED
ncbi:MAG: redox-sensing transcriptional repressor Rex [Clostridia bacterium]|jgi:redox-sensing transcriptional repressor|nr:redox-sensing transcriptional repressor Rex [Clostridia bacterium]